MASGNRKKIMAGPVTGCIIALMICVFPFSHVLAKTQPEEKKPAVVKAAASAQKAEKKAPKKTESGAKKEPPPGISKDPYIGAIVVDPRDGRVLFEDNADATCYPASVVKLMNLLVLEDQIAKGSLKLDDPVTATVEATRMGGTQVWLKENEVFPVEELIYAMMVESANDAATALAIHVAGSTDGFIQMMNEKARELGMKSSRFASVHGLPPSKDREHDITTARDLATLGVALLKYPDVLKYSSVKERPFRNGTFTLRSHNHLLGNATGVDGLKTGYFREGGYCIVVTGQKNGVRLISVVVGSSTRKSRDHHANTMLSKGFISAPPAPPPSAVAQAAPAAAAAAEPVEKKPGRPFRWGLLVMGLGGIAVGVFIGIVLSARRSLIRR